MIVEPLVQGAAGMLVQPDGYLRAVRELCDEHGVAADLRRGRDRLRAHRHDVRLRAGGRRARPDVRGQGPDRRLPAAGRDARRPSAIYEGFLGALRASSARSSTATPTRATRSPARRRSRRWTSSSEERTLERAAAEDRRCSATLLDEHVAPLPARRRGPPPRLHDRHRARRASRSRRAWATRSRSRRARRGAIIRPLGDVVVLMPPLSITEAELRRLVEITAEAIAEATAALARPDPADGRLGDRQRRPPSRVPTRPRRRRARSSAAPAAGRRALGDAS